MLEAADLQWMQEYFDKRFDRIEDILQGKQDIRVCATLEEETQAQIKSVSNGAKQTQIQLEEMRNEYYKKKLERSDKIMIGSIVAGISAVMSGIVGYIMYTIFKVKAGH